MFLSLSFLHLGHSSVHLLLSVLRKGSQWRQVQQQEIVFILFIFNNIKRKIKKNIKQKS
jgi:hypothetical protein